MLFVSTRGQVDKVSSAHAIKEGLAGDGGLFVPQSFPYRKNWQNALRQPILPKNSGKTLRRCARWRNGPMYWNYGMALLWRLRILPCRSYLI